jgi:hypothetical protein
MTSFIYLPVMATFQSFMGFFMKSTDVDLSSKNLAMFKFDRLYGSTKKT